MSFQLACVSYNIDLLVFPSSHTGGSGPHVTWDSFLNFLSNL